MIPQPSPSRRRLRALLLAPILCGGLLFAQTLAHPALNAPPDYPKLREARFARLTGPYGWFSLVALGWIRPGTTTVGSAPGSQIEIPSAPPHLATLQLANDVVTLLAVAPGLQLGNGPAPLHTKLPDDEEDASALSAGRVRMWVIDRGGKKYLRVKDPDAPARLHAHPLAWFAPDARYRVTAKWEPYPTPHTMRVLNELDQVSMEPVPGYAEFSLNGQTYRLQPMIDDGYLFFVFRDTTAQQSTYAAGRFLNVEFPPGGITHPATITLDFNQAVNPPCAYTPFATCPVASSENQLHVAIPAGEKRYD